MIADRRLMAAAIIGLVGCGLGLALDARTLLASYLVAWVAISAIPIGSLAVLLTSYLVRGGWTHDMRAPLTAAALTLPFAGVSLIPILVGLREIYPWVVDAGALPAFKAVYLAPGFFALRTFAAFAVLTILAVWAARAYGDDAAMTRAASAGLIVWSLVVSFLGIDLMESVEPAFHSSVYGLLTIGFNLLAGLAFGLVAVLAGGAPRRMSNTAYSAVLLSVLLLWAYLHAMQYIVIWSGNLPDEVVWYLKRLDHGWGVALWTLFIVQFFLPFFILLSEAMRSSTTALRAIAAVTLVLRVLEAAVLILPPLGVTHFAWLGIPLALLTLGAGFLIAWRAAGELWTRRSGSPAPVH